MIDEILAMVLVSACIGFISAIVGYVMGWLSWLRYEKRKYYNREDES